ncbi:hypothetical protein [Schlesneria paludicola]|uniref:hypothetical protein n=1 Tax=Schlesneria paludicola TaxID=360056 RepID=UPI00029B44F5|nr:hypothetical protein [Schlesneria paludicola]
MLTLKSIAIATLFVTATNQMTLAQGPSRIKVLGEAMQGHELVIYQRHGQEKAQILYYHSQATEPISAADAKELVTAIRKDLKAADFALAKIKTHHDQDTEVQKQIVLIEKHLAKTHEECNLCEHACSKDAPDRIVIGDCCSRIWHEVEAAQYETKKLLRMFKIVRLEPPKRVESKAQAAAR